MPCNSDYMYPTAAERQASDAQKEKIKDHLDTLVHKADLMREDILAVVHGEKDTLDYDYAKKRLTTPTLSALIAEHDRMYVSNRSPEFERLIRDVRKQYYYVLRAGKALQRFDALSPDVQEAIETQQILHRFGDMIRVMGQFTALRTFTPEQVKEIQRFAKVDYTKPLIPQIGFDPDDV